MRSDRALDAPTTSSLTHCQSSQLSESTSQTDPHFHYSISKNRSSINLKISNQYLHSNPKVMLSKGIDSETFSLITNGGIQTCPQTDGIVIAPSNMRPSTGPAARGSRAGKDQAARPCSVPAPNLPSSDFISFDYDPPVMQQFVAPVAPPNAITTTHEAETQVSMSKPSTARSSLEHMAQPNGDRFRTLISKLNTLLREDRREKDDISSREAAINSKVASETHANPCTNANAATATLSTSSGWFSDAAYRHEYYNPYHAVDVPANRPTAAAVVTKPDAGVVQTLPAKPAPPPASIFTTPQQPVKSPATSPVQSHLPQWAHPLLQTPMMMQQTAPVSPTKNGAGDELSITTILTTNVEYPSSSDMQSVTTSSLEQPLNLKTPSTEPAAVVDVDSSTTAHSSTHSLQQQQSADDRHSRSSSAETISKPISHIRLAVKLNQRSSVTRSRARRCASETTATTTAPQWLHHQTQSARKERIKRMGLAGIYGMLFTVMVSASVWPQMQCAI